MLGLLFPRTTLPFGTLPCMDLNAIFILAPSKFVLLAQNCSKFHSSIPNALLTPSFAHGKYEKVSQTCSYLPCANGLLTACPQICHHHLFTPLPLAPVFTILDMESYRFLPFLTPTPTYYNPTKSLLTWAPKCILGPLTFLLVRTTAISCVAAACDTLLTFVLSHFQVIPVVANMILEKSDYFKCLLTPLPLLPLLLKIQFPTMTLRSVSCSAFLFKSILYYFLASPHSSPSGGSGSWLQQIISCCNVFVDGHPFCLKYSPFSLLTTHLLDLEGPLFREALFGLPPVILCPSPLSVSITKVIILITCLLVPSSATWASWWQRLALYCISCTESGTW